MMFKLSSVKKTKPSSSKRYFRKIPTTDQPSSSSKSDSNKNFNYYSNDQSFVLVYTVSKYEILHLFFLTIQVTASSTFGSGIPVKQCVLFYLYRWVAGPEIKKKWCDSMGMKTYTSIRVLHLFFNEIGDCIQYIWYWNSCQAMCSFTCIDESLIVG